MENAHPPSFYDADIEKYKQKFDKSLKQRELFKRRMKDKMSFTDLTWNRNVITVETKETEQDSINQGAGGKHRRNK